MNDVDQLENERAKYTLAFSEPAYRIRCHGLELYRKAKGIIQQKPSSAIDIGCGTGRLFAEWNREGIDGWGLDLVDALDAGHPYAHKLIEGCLWDWNSFEIETANNYSVDEGAYSSDPDERWTPDRLNFDLAICADVMEHIPPEHVEACLQNIAKLAKRTIFKIANYPSSFPSHPHGPLHLTLQPAEWWHEQLSKLGTANRREELEHPQIAEYVFDFYRSED